MYNVSLSNQYNIEKLYAYTFKDNMKTPFSNKESELNDTKELLIDIKNKINSGEFNKNLNSRFCKFCLYRFLCYENGN